MAKTPKKIESGSQRLKDPKWELFCYLYITSDNPKLFGNGQNCYIQAYGKDTEMGKIDDELEKPKEKTETNSAYEERKKLLRLKKKNIETVCRVNAARLLTNDNIRKRCDYLMSSMFNDEQIDREHMHVIKQNIDYRSKITAIDKYNALKKRIEPDNKNLTGTLVVRWNE